MSQRAYSLFKSRIAFHLTAAAAATRQDPFDFEAFRVTTSPLKSIPRRQADESADLSLSPFSVLLVLVGI